MKIRCLAAALAVATGAVCAAPARAAGRNLTGQPAPEIYVQQGIYGLPTGCTLQSFRGRPVVLKFFFANCPACRESLPEFERMFRQYGTRVQFIAVAYDSRWAVEAMWRRAGYSIPLAIDENGLTAQRYGITTYPTSYLVGADGIVRSYDVVTPSLLEREIARGGASASGRAGASEPGAGAATAATVIAGSAPAAGLASGAVPGSVASPSAAVPGVAVPAGERNVVELGDVPAALSGVAAAARDNDYGAVLRLVERHFDGATDAAGVIEAAHRIERIAIERSERRKQRIQALWKLGDPLGAYRQIGEMVHDFRDTQLEAPLREWSDRVRADLVSRGVLVAAR